MSSPRRRLVVSSIALLFLLLVAAWWRTQGSAALAAARSGAEEAMPRPATASDPRLPPLTGDDLPAGTVTSAAAASPSPAVIAAARRLGHNASMRQRAALTRGLTCRLGTEAMAWFDEPLTRAWPPLEQRLLAGDGGAAEVLMTRVSMCEAVRTSAKLAPGPERDRMLAEIGRSLDPVTLAMIDQISADGVAWFDAHSADCGAAPYDMARLTELTRRRALAIGRRDLAELDAKAALARRDLFDPPTHNDDECYSNATGARLMAGDEAPLPRGLRDILRSVVASDGALGSLLAECAARDCRSLKDIPATLQPDLSALAERLGLDDDLRYRVEAERRDGHDEQLFGWLLYQRWLLLNSCTLTNLPTQVATMSEQLQAAAAHLDAGRRQRGIALAQQLVAGYGAAALRVRGCGP